MLYFIGLLVLSLLITALIVFAILVLASGFAYWLATSPSTIAIQLRKLSKQPPKQPLEETNQDTATNTSYDGSQQGGQKYKCLIYRLHPIQSIQKLYPLLKASKWGIDNFARTRESLCTNQKKNYKTEYPKAGIETFVPRRPFPSWMTSPFWHMGTILTRLRKSVNENGKEP